jgi:hypothetical protein
MVFETDVRIRLNIANGSQRQGREQLFVSQTSTNPLNELARQILARRILQQAQQWPQVQIRIGNAEAACQPQTCRASRVDEGSSVHREHNCSRRR